jgi:hypothetical protein
MSFLRLLVLACLPMVIGRATDADNVSVNLGVSVSSVDDFYEPLCEYGRWVDVHAYGRCWYPYRVEPGWQPYVEGAWIWTDCGWYWDSPEPWAWATYRYGRWFYHSYYGWLWMPGVVWGPAWVTWRQGGGYIGWAPLPPECDFGPTGYIVTERLILMPSIFVYVSYGNFCRPIRSSSVCTGNTYIHQTVNVTKIKKAENVIINEGPSIDVIEKSTGTKIVRTPLTDVRPSHGRKENRPPTIKTVNTANGIAHTGQRPTLADIGRRGPSEVASRSARTAPVEIRGTENLADKQAETGSSPQQEPVEIRGAEPRADRQADVRVSPEVFPRQQPPQPRRMIPPPADRVEPIDRETGKSGHRKQVDQTAPVSPPTVTHDVRSRQSLDSIGTRFVPPQKTPIENSGKKASGTSESGRKKGSEQVNPNSPFLLP